VNSIDVSINDNNTVCHSNNLFNTNDMSLYAAKQHYYCYIKPLFNPSEARTKNNFVVGKNNNKKFMPNNCKTIVIKSRHNCKTVIIKSRPQQTVFNICKDQYSGWITYSALKIVTGLKNTFFPSCAHPQNNSSLRTQINSNHLNQSNKIN